jgi:hypothetical protein
MHVQEGIKNQKLSCVSDSDDMHPQMESRMAVLVRWIPNDVAAELQAAASLAEEFTLHCQSSASKYSQFISKYFC